MKHYILFNKPFGVLSQFTRQKGYKALSDFGPFPKNVYPAGRLDAKSEGLLFLTNDNLVKHRLMNPRFEHKRIYLVQVCGKPSEEQLEILRAGIVKNNLITKPAKVKILDNPPDLPPLRNKIAHKDTSWLEITIFEGKTHQVRKMVAFIGYPALRLIRIAIEFLTLDGISPGKHRSLTENEIKRLKELLLIV